VAELTAPDRLGERRRRAGAALQQAEGLGGGGEQDPVDDEAVDLLADQHRDAADTAHEVHRGTHRLLARPRPADHLAELHHGDRMGEVHVAAALRPGHDVDQARDGDGAGVAGEHRIGRGLRAQPGPGLAPGRQVLEDRIDHQVGVADRPGQVGRGADPAEHAGGLQRDLGPHGPRSNDRDCGDFSHPQSWWWA